MSLFLVLFISHLALGEEKAPKAKTSDKSKEDLYVQMELFADAVSAIRSDYVDDVDSKKLVYGALKGLLGSLDDYSQFMDPDEYRDIKVEAKGEFGGIGIEVNMRDGMLTVIAPIAGSPADKAGVMAGDRIVKINGKITKKMSLDDAVKELRGEPGTSVSLTLWREKQEKIIEIPVKRDIIKIKSIKEAIFLEDKIGYIKLVEFQENTPQDLEEAMAKLKKEGMDSLILDLRNNPGGLLDVAVAVTEKLLPKESPIVSTKSRVAGQNVEFKSKSILAYVDMPLVVLVNEGSASASEIVAGAIQDNKRGIILGMKSFGKGSVQTVMPLKDGSALRLTTASYFTPSGRCIRGTGIIPDVVIEQAERPETPKGKKEDIFEKVEPKAEGKVEGKDAELKRMRARDSQLERAIDIVKGIKAYKQVKA
jgi:carboxyl-terminal processing protease